MVSSLKEEETNKCRVTRGLYFKLREYLTNENVRKIEGRRPSIRFVWGNIL